ncbi:hypothetical protein [Streptomyces sp. NPDC055036]
MREFRAERIGVETGTYLLPCGCKIYVQFPGGHIHLASGWAKCPELSRLWAEYWASCRNGHDWTSLNHYIACLRHVGAWAGRIASMERERDHYPNPADRVVLPVRQTET